MGVPAFCSPAEAEVRHDFANHMVQTYDNAVSMLVTRIMNAIASGDYRIGKHAAIQCEERDVMIWQVVSGSEKASVKSERPRSKPNASIILSVTLADGTQADCIWSWLKTSQQAKLVTVFFNA